MKKKDIHNGLFGKKTELIKIYFKKILDSLEGFSFNNDNIKKVDFSHFDFSKFESAQNMFQGRSLEAVDLSNINAPRLTNMDSMFQDSSILSVNLSNFTAPNVTSMNNIFKGCNDLKVLDISGFVFNSEVSSNSLFEELPSLLYLNIKDVTFQDNIRTQFQNLVTSKSGMTVCQNDQVLNKTENKNPKNDYRCCNFILEGGTCESFNFIKAIYKLDYGKEVGIDFIPIEYQGFGNQRSEQILYIEKGDKYFNPKANFSIDGDYYVEIKIHFSQGFVDLKNMFSFEIDTNVKYIVSIDFSNFSSLITDMSKLFYECENLTSVDFSNVNTSSVTNMNSMFADCSQLTSIDLSNFNTSLVTNMNSMFANCKSFTSIDLYNFNTPKLVDIGSMFEGCTSLEIVKLHHFDTSLVSDMSKMFYNCNKLLFVDISCFNMQNVNNSENMFYGLQEIYYANLYNAEDPKGIISNSALNKVNNLNVCQKDGLITYEIITNICFFFSFYVEEHCYLPSQWGCLGGSIIKHFVKDDTNLFRISFASDVVYPNGFGNENRKNIKYIVNKEHNKKTLPSDNITFFAGKVYEIYINSSMGEKDLENYFNANDDNNLKQIISIDVILPNSSSVKSLVNMFYGCTSLESVSLVYIDTSSVESFKGMFRKCSALKRLDLSHLDTSSVTSMNYMFK